LTSQGTGKSTGPAARWLVAACLIALLVGLRLYALSSDAYTRLDWSAGILTDEGFYVHNARNIALFGHARTDDFNNMLLSPLLHYLQTGVFLTFGTGAVEARQISVVCSLLTLIALYSALKRTFDNRIALTGVIFLGLDHCNLLYNRMALMDTPAALPAVLAFWAFTKALQASSSNEDGKKTNPGIWFAVSGILLGITLVSRMLCLYLVPVPFIGLYFYRRRVGTEAAQRKWMPIFAGLMAVCVLYLAVWYLPNRAEIAPMNAYYRTHQMQPRSVNHLIENIKHAFVGDFRGEAPYLFRHTPILFALVLILLASLAVKRSDGDQAETSSIVSSGTAYLTAWLLLGWAMLAVISYSPSRYYVTVYPAFASLAAVSIWRLREIVEILTAPNFRAKLARTALVGFLVFHAVLSVVHYGGVVSKPLTVVLIYGLPVIAAAVSLLWKGNAGKLSQSATSRLALATGAMWCLVNGYWLTDWARSLAFSQTQMSRWLGQNLPSGSVLIGDVSPGLCLDNAFLAIHVQPGLVNDRQPVERFAGAPRYAVILDGRWKEQYWLRQYPRLVDPSRRIKLARVLRWDIGVYAIDGPAAITDKDAHSNAPIR
jgi:4-amino-4-deoxy-L-arabinose transferase-like glycosyltransferase